MFRRFLTPKSPTNSDKPVKVLPPALLQAKELARWLDSAFRIPFINKTIGLDPILDMLPFFAGDIIGIAFSLHIMHIAYQLGCPRPLLLKMLRNIVIDFGVGAVPLVGPLLDAYWKANRMNIVLLEKAWLKDGYAWPVRHTPLIRPSADPVIEVEAH